MKRQVWDERGGLGSVGGLNQNLSFQALVTACEGSLRQEGCGRPEVGCWRGGGEEGGVRRDMGGRRVGGWRGKLGRDGWLTQNLNLQALVAAQVRARGRGRTEVGGGCKRRAEGAEGRDAEDEMLTPSNHHAPQTTALDTRPLP